MLRSKYSLCCSLSLEGGTTIQSWQGYPIVTWSRNLPVGTGLGTLPFGTGWGYPLPGLDGATPSCWAVGTGWGYPLSELDGVPPPLVEDKVKILSSIILRMRVVKISKSEKVPHWYLVVDIHFACCLRSVCDSFNLSFADCSFEGNFLICLSVSSSTVKGLFLFRSYGQPLPLINKIMINCH